MACLDSFLLRHWFSHNFDVSFWGQQGQTKASRVKYRQSGKKRAAVAFLVSISQSSSEIYIARWGGLSSLWYSPCQGRTGRCQAEHFTLAWSHWGLTMFLLASPELNSHSLVQGAYPTSPMLTVLQCMMLFQKECWAFVWHTNPRLSSLSYNSQFICSLSDLG